MYYRAVLLTLLLAITLPNSLIHASGETRYEPRPRVTDPSLEALGGGSVAAAHGAAAIRSNPAAFSDPWRIVLRGAGGLAVVPGDIPRIGSSVVSGAMLPVPRNFASEFASRFGDDGFGFSGSGEFFVSGFNVGLGFFTDHEAFMRGSGTAGSDGSGFDEAEGFLISEAGLGAGIAVPFTLGAFDISVGGAVRPMLRVRGSLDDPDAVGAFADGTRFDEAFAETRVLNGFALGLDAGILARRGNLSLGASVRDIGNSVVDYREHSLSEVVDESSEGRLPDGGDGDGTLLDPDATYVIPMQTRIGAAYTFELPQIESTVFADIYDPHRLFASNDRGLDARGHTSAGSGSVRPVDHLSAGIDVGMFGFLSTRAGVNSDGPSLGFGAELGPLTLDASMRFSDGSSSSASVGAKLRF